MSNHLLTHAVTSAVMVCTTVIVEIIVVAMTDGLIVDPPLVTEKPNGSPLFGALPSRIEAELGI